MEKFATLEPVRLYNNPIGAKTTLQRTPQKPQTLPFIGRLPSDLHLLILSFLSIPDLPAYARCNHATSSLSRSEGIWEARWKALGVEKYDLDWVLDALESKSRGKAAASRAAAPASIPVDDDFGDFESGDIFSAPSAEEMGDFVGAFNPITPVTARLPTLIPTLPTKPTFRTMYTRAHTLLKPLTKALASPPHTILTELASMLPEPSLRQESLTLHLLSLFLSPKIKPLRKWESMYASLRSAMDRFDANALAGFDSADGRGDEDGMREAAEASWQMWDGTGDWEMGKVWAEKLEIFYQQGQWRPLDNFTAEGYLNFDAMHDFMDSILGSILEHGARAVRVFPPASGTLIAFCDRVATEIVSDYITSLLTRAREISNPTFLKATAATFGEAWRMADAIMQAAAERADSNIPRNRAEDVVYRMFEINMDEYLDEEVDSVKLAFEITCKSWDRQMAEQASAGDSATRFLSAQNPAQVKRNVLASFTSALLVPVTIVPRAIGGTLVAGGTAAVNGIAMLNPQRWATSNGPTNNGYSKNLELDKGMFDPDEDEKSKRASIAPSISSASSSTSRLDLSVSSRTSTTSGASTPLPANKFDLLLSLDIALELIHADHEALKRVETFADYPGHYGHRVRDTIEELFILLLQTLGERHVTAGFNVANEQMTSYKPEEHSLTTSVAPLLQFFELVHIGDMIQSMVQVFFDKELAPHIDRTDFLSPVVREKKRFENALDDSVATGLNSGTQVLMNQVEHIILTLTQPREYYPVDDSMTDLGATKGCTEAIKCLDMHCKLLKGSTSKEVLEVFYQEVGIRLIAILQKHIKRQIISLSGGFHLIADLNAYHSFIASLKVPAITAEFSHLKMLGHVYVVDDAKDLAQIVRDVSRYGGAYRPEDIYEFIQRRSDWKKIEKTVDQTMYNLSFKEDCIIC
uniref:F-box domain-containing protein n=1 Tax=Mycena chlorophos TaxID=658473 RepID=A0ABQ0M9F8_MYCCL|nr:predicted protein [Mycena chlorophos]